MKTPGWVLRKKEATVGVLHKILGGGIFMRGVNIRTTWAARPRCLPLPAPWPTLCAAGCRCRSALPPLATLLASPALTTHALPQSGENQAGNRGVKLYIHTTASTPNSMLLVISDLHINHLISLNKRLEVGAEFHGLRTQYVHLNNLRLVHA